MFGLFDMNNFYASVESIFRPDLHHNKVVVLSNNDGALPTFVASFQPVKPRSLIKRFTSWKSYKYRTLIESNKVSRSDG
jgi:hypothetical protein